MYSRLFIGVVTLAFVIMGWAIASLDRQLGYTNGNVFRQDSERYNAVKQLEATTRQQADQISDLSSRVQKLEHRLERLEYPTDSERSAARQRAEKAAQAIVDILCDQTRSKVSGGTLTWK